jgi:hypothetical protein
MPLVLLADNLSVPCHVTGRWKAPTDPLLSSYVGFLRWSIHALNEAGFVKYYPDALIHRHREENQAADSLANCVLDWGRPLYNIGAVSSRWNRCLLSPQMEPPDNLITEGLMQLEC